MLLHAVQMFPFFFCGALFGMSDGVKNAVTSNGVVYTVALAAYFALVLTGTKTIIINLPGIFAVIVLMGLFSHYDAKIPSLLSTVGTYSLEIYVFHWFFLPSLPWVKPLLSENIDTLELFNYNIAVLATLTFAVAAVIVAACMALAVAVRHSPLLGMVLLGSGGKKWRLPDIQGNKTKTKIETKG